MRFLRRIPFIFVFFVCNIMAAPNAVHVWEKQELTFNAENPYTNAYMDVILWVDLPGPGLIRESMDSGTGADYFIYDLLQPSPESWTWKSGSIPEDPGSGGKVRFLCSGRLD